MTWGWKILAGIALTIGLLVAANLISVSSYKQGLADGYTLAGTELSEILKLSATPKYFLECGSMSGSGTIQILINGKVYPIPLACESKI